MNVDTLRRTPLGDRGRGRVTEASERVAVLNVDLVRVLVDGILHLTEDVVDVDEILLGPRVVGHG